MQNPDPLSAALVPRGRYGRGLSEAQNLASKLAQDVEKNNLFVALLNAFRPSGGLARAQEVAGRFQLQGGGEVCPLEAWINKREVISVEWQSKLWLPLFQFNPVGLTLRAGLSAVLLELVGRYDDWQLASWFARPNAWLGDCAAADVLAVAAPQVLKAALAERATGAG